jgi:hypothetical protein
MVDNLLILVPPSDPKWPIAVQAVFRSLHSSTMERSRPAGEGMYWPAGWKPNWRHPLPSFHLDLLLQIPCIDLPSEEFGLYEYVTVCMLRDW